VAGLAALYYASLDDLGLEDVTVIGNSVGGWIAAEMSLLDSPRLTAMVLLDAVGIEVEGPTVADVSGLSAPEIQGLSFHDPAPFRVDPATIGDAQREIMAADGRALAIYAGSAAMTDPTLLGRLGGIAIPTLVLWGESDRIVEPAYGQAYATACDGARFEVLPATGHVPQLETPIWCCRRSGNGAQPVARAPRRPDPGHTDELVVLPGDVRSPPWISQGTTTMTGLSRLRTRRRLTDPPSRCSIFVDRPTTMRSACCACATSARTRAASPTPRINLALTPSASARRATSAASSSATWSLASAAAA
jgi:Alpha/beta hydrolase family